MTFSRGWFLLNLLRSIDFAKVGGCKVQKSESWYNISGRCCTQCHVFNFLIQRTLQNQWINAGLHVWDRDKDHKHSKTAGVEKFHFDWNLQMDMTWRYPLLLPRLGQAGSFGYSVSTAKCQDPASESERAGEEHGRKGRKPCVWCRHAVGIAETVGLDGSQQPWGNRKRRFMISFLKTIYQVQQLEAQQWQTKTMINDNPAEGASRNVSSY